jgi:hypothetical protein
LAVDDEVGDQVPARGVCRFELGLITVPEFDDAAIRREVGVGHIDAVVPHAGGVGKEVIFDSGHVGGVDGRRDALEVFVAGADQLVEVGHGLFGVRTFDGFELEVDRREVHVAICIEGWVVDLDALVTQALGEGERCSLQGAHLRTVSWWPEALRRGA